MEDGNCGGEEEENGNGILCLKFQEKTVAGFSTVSSK